jgi:hypothetical protein
MMQIARLQNEKSIAEVVAKVYKLQPSDPKVATATQALLAANPQLKNLAQLPAGTPMVIPQVAGVSANSSSVANPQQTVWMAVLDKLLDSAKNASNAQATGVAANAPKTVNPQRATALTTLQNDIAQFKKLH